MARPPGPSTTWLLRRLAAGFEYSPEGFDLDLAETARSLGLGDRSGRHSPFVRSINRTVQFGLAQISGPEELSARRRLPPLNRAQLCRLSPALQARHTAWRGGAITPPGQRAAAPPGTPARPFAARTGRRLRLHRTPVAPLALPGTHCPGRRHVGGEPETRRVARGQRYPGRDPRSTKPTGRTTVADACDRPVGRADLDSA